MCCKCSYCHRVATKERHKSQCMSNVHRNKICEICFICRSLVFCKSCHQCPRCCFRSSCRGEVKPVLGEMGSPGFKCKSSHHSEGGLYSPVPVQTPLDKVTDCNKQLPQIRQAVLPFRGTVSDDIQECSRTGRKSKLTGFLHAAIFATQNQQPVETAPMEFTVVAKEVKLMALQKGKRIHQYLDDWLVRASTHDTCLQHTQNLVTLCQDLGWLVNREKSELVPKQVFKCIGYQFDLKEGRVRPSEDRWQTLTDKIRSRSNCPLDRVLLHILDTILVHCILHILGTILVHCLI